MTMPRYQNCPHRDEGWCLACVNEVHDQLDKLQADQDAHSAAVDNVIADIKAAGHRFPVCAYCQEPHVVSDGSMARHVAACPKNPLVQRIAALESGLDEALRAWSEICGQSLWWPGAHARLRSLLAPRAS